MIDLVHAIADLDQYSPLHEARLLFLLNAFSRDPNGGAIEGLTKLAKLDFLFRYPSLLERALEAKHKSIKDVNLQDYEKYSVETKMVRYRFGPWDHRYREFLNILVAKGLASINIEGKTVVISITKRGQKLVEELSSDYIFEPYVKRASILKRHFDLKGTNLMNFIYHTFPEIISLQANSPILI